MHQLPHVNNQELLSISAPTVRKIYQTTINQDRGRNDVNLPLNDSCSQKKYHCNRICKFSARNLPFTALFVSIGFYIEY